MLRGPRPLRDRQRAPGLSATTSRHASLIHPDLYTMRSTLLASTWACLLLGCSGLAGTYRGDGERLREQLTLFPDSTYQHVWWTDIIMGDAGR